MSELTRHLGSRLDERAQDLALAWLDVIVEGLSEEPHRVFPTQTLLNRIPEVLKRLARSLSDRSALSQDDFVVGELRKLVELRRLQGYALSEIVTEFDTLARIFFDAIVEELAEHRDADALEVIELARSANLRFAEISRVATSCFVELQADDRSDRARLLNAYGRLLSHELRNRANTAGLQIQLALEALQAGDTGSAEQSLRAAKGAVEHVIASGFDSLAATALQRHEAPANSRRQSLRALVGELAGDLDDYARHYGVKIEVLPDFPDLQVEAGRLQLALACLIGGAIRFPGSTDDGRRIEILGRSHAGLARIEIRHDGSGISRELHSAVLGAAQVASVTGESPGVGLVVARDAIEQVGGKLTFEISSGERPTYVIEIPEPTPELEVAADGS